MDSWTVANRAFALELFHALNQEDPSANLLFSPFSVSSAMAMVFLGTRGSTEAQLAKTLHFDTVKEIHQRFQSLNSDINKHGTSSILKVANRLYGEKTYKFLPEFLDLTQKFYGGDLAHVDFQCASPQARQVINEWVKGQTEGKIPELLTTGVVDSMTKLLLVNAIYFNGKWEKEFPKQATHEAPFKVNKNETKKVMMMYQRNKFTVGYIEAITAYALQISFLKDEFSMLIMLPDNNEGMTTGLQEIEKQMNLENLNEWTKPENMPVKVVDVYLPRFKLKEIYTLNSHLAHLGLTQLFDPSQADLSAMSEARDIFISKIVHKSFVEVNEEGTKVKASTADNVNLCMMESGVEFKCDRPFLFLILHNVSKMIIFMGKCTSP
ncbi:leukocyte elastase inhibitor-like [Suncus etruscus]|uniref:leukocyte elastase inhibitor-like n=1 Tax=Suncus etruscus TaxID=109475 RepID=UPI00210FF0B0|nr:leukocyte elastase inhibitor-like [Suncus etruscus]